MVKRRYPGWWKIALTVSLLFLLAPLVLVSQEGGQSRENTNSEEKDSGNEEILLAFQRNFARGSLTTKIQVLQDAASMEDVAMGPLYQQALEFVLDNLKTLRDDTAARELSVLAVNLVGMTGYSAAADLVWKIFESTATERIRVAAMSTLGRIAEDHPVIVSRMNNWMASQNNAMRTSGQVEKDVIAECILALGQVGNENSYRLLFSASYLKYSKDITYRADRAMEELAGDYRENIIGVIEQNPPEEKLEALVRASGREDLGLEDRAAIAVKALSHSLQSRSSDEDERSKIRQIRYKAAQLLTEYRWSGATPFAIDHFEMTITETEQGRTPLSRLIEAVNFLGSMGTHEAAVRLSLYLEVLNTFVENGQPVDTQVALAVVNNLGALGDRVAFDYLLYTGYLDYAPVVKRAAREALNRLRN